jgi:hypothetical protein
MRVNLPAARGVPTLPIAPMTVPNSMAAMGHRDVSNAVLSRSYQDYRFEATTPQTEIE